MASALLKALADCGEKDLEEIDRRISEIETELGALKAARKVVEARLGRAPKRGGRRAAGRRSVAAGELPTAVQGVLVLQSGRRFATSSSTSL